MSGTVSCATDRPYGVKLVCHTWEQPRSSYYADRQVSGLPVKLTQPSKRGPKTVLSDAELLELIRAGLKASPFQGEGHRKVWARRGNPHLHEGEIITPTPNLMWGTDGAKVFTVEEGWGWLFVTVEHWNAECLGWLSVNREPDLRPWSPFPKV
jgi:hypothetical protein